MTEAQTEILPLLKQPQKLSTIEQKPQQVQHANVELLDEVRNLKRIIETFTTSKQKTFLKQISKEEQSNPQSEQLHSKIKKAETFPKKPQTKQDIYKNFKSDWRSKITSRRKPLPQPSKQQHLQISKYRLQDTKDKQNILEQADKNILQESIIKKHLDFINSRSDSDEEQPVKTQFINPPKRSNSHNDTQLHFKKPNMVSVIEDQHNRFRSYVTSHKKGLKQQKNQRYQPNQRSLHEKSDKSKLGISHPSLNYKQKQPSRQQRLQREVKKIEILKDQSKENLIQKGSKLFRLLYPSWKEQTLFHIKKYRNCLVFSLLPTVTKAAIYYYTGDIYFGNISLDEDGKMEKNGEGIEIVLDRHFYEGQFFNGKKNGRGKIIYQNGDKFQGQWYQGEIYGFGRYVDIRNDRLFQGFWRKGEYCGQKSNNQFVPFQFS